MCNGSGTRAAGPPPTVTAMTTPTNKPTCGGLNADGVTRCKNHPGTCPHEINGTHRRAAEARGTATRGTLALAPVFYLAPADDDLDGVAGPSGPHWAPCQGYLMHRGMVTDQACDHKAVAPDAYCGAHRCGERHGGLPLEMGTGAVPAAADPLDPTRDYWLSDLGTVLGGINDSDTFMNAIARASSASVGGGTKSMEAAVAAELGSPTTTAALLAHVQQAAAANPFRTLAPVAGMTWRYLEKTSATSDGGKKGVRDQQGADIMCDIQFADGRQLGLPINVKWRQVGSTVKGEGLNRRTWFHGLRTGKGEGRNVKEANPSRDLLDLYADEFDIQPFEYGILMISADKATGKLYSARIQGLMSTQVDDASLAASPHSTKPDTVNCPRSRGPLSWLHNVRLSVIKATNRTPSNDEAKLSLLTHWERNTPGRSEELVQARARAIRDADPVAFAAALEALFGALPAAGSAPRSAPAAVQPSLLD